jgi:hypothetical protein
MVNKKYRKPPLWGNFIGYADEDMLSIGLLVMGGIRAPAYYHATQAIEKYFKALILSILDPEGGMLTPENKKWLLTHDLEELASYCSGRFKYYNNKKVLDNLKLFSEYNQVTRYPWVKQKHGNGFSTKDFVHFEDIILHLRNDIPIKIDDYKLAIAVRRCHHKHPKIKLPEDQQEKLAIFCLKKVFPKLNKFVRW